MPRVPWILLAALLFALPVHGQTTTLAPTTSGTVTFNATSGTATIEGNSELLDAVTFLLEGPDPGDPPIATLSGALSGTGSLLFGGPGTLTLTGSSSYSGGTTVNGGATGATLEVATGGAIHHTSATLGVGTLGSTGSFLISGGDVANLDAIVGDGGQGFLTMSAGVWTTLGTLTLGGSGTSFGQFTLEGGDAISGSLQIGVSADSFGFASLTGGHWTIAGDAAIGVDGFGFLSLAGGDMTVGGTLSRGASGVIALQSGGVLLIGTGAAGAGVLATDLTNDGSLRFNRSDDSTYAGIILGTGAVTKLGAGTLTFTGANTYTGITTVAEGGLQIGDGVTTGSIVGDVANNGTLTFNPATDITFSSVISGSGTFVKLGAGTLSLTGATTYTGGTLINGGRLEVAVGGGISHDAASIVIGSGTSGELLVSGGSVMTAAGIVGTGAGGSGTATITAGTWTTMGDLTVGDGAATGALTISGAGTLIVDGTLSRGAAGTIELAAGGTLRIGSGNASGLLATDLVNDGTVVFDRSDAFTYALAISGAGTVVKTGSGTLTFSGSNSYSGGTTIDGGTLAITSGGIIDHGSAEVLVGTSISGGTLEVSGGTVTDSIGTIGYHSAGAATVASGTWSNAGDLRIGWGNAGDPTPGPGTGSLTLTGGSITNAAAYLGFDAGSSGTATISGGSWTSSDTLWLGRGGGVGVVDLSGGTVSAATIRIGGDASSSGTATVGGGSLTTNGTLSVGYDGGTGALTITSGSVFSAASAIGSDSSSIGTATVSGGGWTTQGDLIVGNYGTGSLTISGSGTVAVGGLLGRGAGGTIDLASGGTLQIGLGGTTGALTTAIVNNGTLVFNRSDNSTLTEDAITGAGTVVMRGPGTLTLSGSNAYSGGTTLEAGVLALENTEAIGTAGTISFTGGTLQFSAANTADYSSRFNASGSQSISLDTNGQTVTLGSAIAGAGTTLAKLGDGTLILAADNTFDGATTIASGTLRIGAGGTVGSVAGGIVNGGLLVFDRSDALTYAGSISGTGLVVQQGSGVLMLSGSSDLSGGVDLQAGTLALGSAGAVGTTSTISFTGGTLQFTAANTTDLSTRFATTAGQVYRINTGGQSVTLAGDLSSVDGSLVKTGSGTLTLSGSNELSSGTTLSAGTLALGSIDALGSTGTISFFGGSLQFTAANTADYSSRFATTAGQQYSIDTGGQSVTLAGNLPSAGGSLVKQGAGTLTLTGSSGLSGGTTLAGGLLAVGGADALGSTGTISFTGGGLQFTAANTADYSGRFDATGGQAFVLDTNGQTVTLATAIAGNGSTLEKRGAGTLLLTADNTFDGLTTVTTGTLRIGAGGATGALAGDLRNDAVVVFDRSDAATYAGAISGAGALVKVGGNALTLSGAGTFTGETHIDEGALVLGSAGAIGTSGSIFFGGGTLTFSAANTSDVSARISSTGGQVIRIDTADQAVAFATGLAGAGTSLVKTGGGTLTLSAASSYTAGTTIDGGVLEVTTGGLIDHAAADLVVGSTAASGTLRLAGGSVTAKDGLIGLAAGGSGSVTVTSGSLNMLGNLQVGVAADGLLEISTAGRVIVGGNLVRGSSGSIVLATGGILQIGTSGTTGALLTDLSNNGTLIFDRSDNSTYFGVISGSGAVAKQGAGTLTLSAENTFTGLTTIAAGALRLGDGVSNGSLAGNVQDDAQLIFEPATSGTFSGSISGTGSVTMQGSGTLLLTGSSSYSGPTAINGGILALGSGDAIGSIGTISFGGGTLQFSAANTTDSSGRFSAAEGQTISLDTNGQTVTLAAAISGSGSTLTKLGDGTLVLAADNTYSGLTTVSAGTLALGAGGTTGLVAGDILNGATLVFNRSDDVAYAGSLSGTGTVVKQGLGTLAVTGSSTASGPFSVTAGTLSIGSGGTGGSIVGDVVNDSVLMFNRSDTFTYTGAISGTGSLVKLGAGTLTLSGSSTYAGLVGDYGTIVTGGTLSLAAGGSISHAAADLLVGGTAGTGAILLDGGSLANQRGYVGYDGTGSATVTSGSWHNSGDLIIGLGLAASGAGTLTISGGEVTANNAILGMFSSGAGTVTVTGGLLTTTDSLRVGLSGGTGILNVAGGGVTAASINLGTDTASTGSVTVTGGTMTALGRFTVGSADGSGRLSIDSSGVVRVGGDLSRGDMSTITLGSGGTLAIGLGGGSGNLLTDLTNNGTVVFNRSNEATFADTISGFGGVVKRGAGTLTFTGSNGYSGGTSLEEGTLALGSFDALGTSGTISFNGGTLQFSGSNKRDYSASFATTPGQQYRIDTNGQDLTLATGLTSSGGSLVKIGGGTLTLTGENTFDGGTVFSSGTLQVGDGGSSGTIIGNIVSGADLVFNRSGDVVYSGTISGDGNVTKLGDGTLTFTADNLFLGSMNVAAGTLQLGDGGTAGSVRGNILNDGTVAFNHSEDETFSAILYGSGVVAKRGSNTLTLTGSNSYTGGTDLVAGTLSLGSMGALGSTGTISFNGGTLQFTSANTQDLSNRLSTAANQQYRLDTGGQNVTLASGLTSSGGSLQKFGGGLLTLTGSSTFDGGTTVEAGGLAVNGFLASGPVSIAASALLQGSGTIGGAVTVGGTLSPGNSPGLLTMDSLALAATSVTILEVMGSGTTAGTAGTDYGSLKIQLVGGLGYGGSLNFDFQTTETFDIGTTFQMFTFTGTASGGFTSIQTAGSGDYAGLVFTKIVPGTWVSAPAPHYQRLKFSEVTGELVVVPEPATWVMLLGAVGWMAWSSRRRIARSMALPQRSSGR